MKSNTQPKTPFQILCWCNIVLQGQFRKYKSVIDEVAKLCIENTNSIDEATEWFHKINFAVARIITQNYLDNSCDSPIVLEIARELNQCKFTVLNRTANNSAEDKK